MKRFVFSTFFLFPVISMANISEYGKVIIINGPSACGKTSIQKKIQEFAELPYLRLGIDQLFDNILPDYYGLGEIEPKGKFDTNDIRYVTTIDVAGKPAIKLHIGKAGRKVISGMHYAIAEYVKQGNNVVVDYIKYEDDWLEELQKALENIEVFYVGIKYPLEIIEAREKSRSTSPVGHARSHYYAVHDGLNYDLEITDPSLSAEEIAKKILS